MDGKKESNGNRATPHDFSATVFLFVCLFICLFVSFHLTCFSDVSQIRHIFLFVFRVCLVFLALSYAVHPLGVHGGRKKVLYFTNVVVHNI